MGKVVAIAPAALKGYDALHKKFSSKHVSRGAASARPLFLRGKGSWEALRKRNRDEEEDHSKGSRAKRHRGTDDNGGCVVCHVCESTVATHLGFAACAICKAPCVSGYGISTSLFWMIMMRMMLL